MFSQPTIRAAGAKGTTAFIVPKDTPGYNPQARDHKLGIHAAHSCTVFFEHCRVPKANQLGGTGSGFKIAMSTLDGGRIGIASQALGIARAAFDKACAYAKERKAFGEVIANKQAIQFMLADMRTEIDAAHLLTMRAAHLKDKGERRFSAEAAMAKLFASENGPPSDTSRTADPRGVWLLNRIRRRTPLPGRAYHRDL